MKCMVISIDWTSYPPMCRDCYAQFEGDDNND